MTEQWDAASPSDCVVGLVILVLARERGASTEELGALFAITAAGGVIGALLTPRLVRALTPRVLVVAFGWLGASATLLLLTTQSPYLIGALGALAFLLFPAVNTLLFATIAAEAPDGLQGRANSAALQATSIAAPAAPLVAGLLLGAIGAATTILIYSCALFALAIVASATPALGCAVVES